MDNENARQGTFCSPAQRRKLRQTLDDWLSIKSHGRYYQYLNLLTYLTQSVFRQQATINPHTALTSTIQDKLQNHYQELLPRLIHSITLLNHPYRVQTTKGYESTKEDVLSAAALLQLDFDPKGLLQVKTKLIYWELQTGFGQEAFSIKEAATYLQMHKKTIRYHVVALLNAGELELSHTGSRNTNYYRIG